MNDIEGIFGGNKEQPIDKLQQYKDLKAELEL